MQRAGTGARRAFEWPSSESQTAEDVDDLPEPVVPAAVQHRLLDGAEAYPDVVGPSVRSRRRRSRQTSRSSDFESVESVFETSSEHTEYRLPDRAVLRASPTGATAKSDASAKTADLLVRTLSEFGVEAKRHGPDLRPARHPLRAAARARRRSRRSPG